MFTDNFLDSLSNDPKIAGYEVLSQYDKKFQNVSVDDESELGLCTYALLEAISEANSLNWELPPIKFDEPESHKEELINFFKSLKDELSPYALVSEEQRKLKNYRQGFLTKIKNTFIYEFSDGDLEQIQSKLNSLRDFISKSTLFEDKHKQRLLKRLELLQQELHKKQSDLDRYWGLIGDAGVILGKLGKDAKPIVDRVKEITEIVWRTQSRAEELPSDAKPPLLNSESE
ncbi:hypothetical protein [Aliamphritea ceti]|uniref:hypothetical protein n=1 Tax=Aliamphritea ceti TaxID=1524258 RepID=UPI0021C3B369|nr:hypothetical protein [Aliamphritea ceti]